MISQQRVEALCKKLEEIYIPDGPLHTEYGARHHVRGFIIKLLKDEQPGYYERVTYLVRSLYRDCEIQATNDKQTPDLRAEYAMQAKAWKDFDPMVQALWYKGE